MKKRWIVVVFILAAVALVALAHHGPTTLVLKEAQKKQPPVTFSHEKHAKVAKSCDTCHHTQKGLKTDQGTKVVKCTTCHLDPKDAKIPSMREASLTKNPFHINCIKCHKDGKKGPTACTGCHKKA